MSLGHKRLSLWGAYCYLNSDVIFDTSADSIDHQIKRKTKELASGTSRSCNRNNIDCTEATQWAGRIMLAAALNFPKKTRLPLPAITVTVIGKAESVG